MKEVEIIKNSFNKHQALVALGWDTRTVGYRKLNNFILKNNIDISHFETRSQQIKRQNLCFSKKISLSDILISGSTYQNTTALKKRLYREGIKEPICEKCGQNEIWRGMYISMILDHINGVHNDNRIENLRILCPNCNAALPTHCGRNIRRTIKEKKERNFLEISKKQRKINRPSFKQLNTDISLLGYCGAGRKYGVSDNAIRKWIRFYEKHV